MPNSLTLVELMLKPEVVYNILDALYENTYNKPEDNVEAIQCVERAMEQQELPLERGSYEEQIASVSNQSSSDEWRDINVVFPVPVGH